MTHNDLDALRRLHEAATDPLWRIAVREPLVGNFWMDGLPKGSTAVEKVDGSFPLGEAVCATPHGHDADAALIVAVRNALPHLLAEISELRGENKILREALEEAINDLEALKRAPDSDYARPDDGVIAAARAALERP